MKMTVPPALSGQRVEKRWSACCCQDKAWLAGKGADGRDRMGINSGEILGEQWAILPQGCPKTVFFG
jgi:hypothetical protein